MGDPFASSAILISVHGEDVLQQLCISEPPPLLSLDQICRDGISTGVMLTSKELADADGPQGLIPQLSRLVKSHSPSNFIVIHAASRDFSLWSPNMKQRGIILIQADTLAQANLAATKIEAMRQRCQKDCEAKTSSFAVIPKDFPKTMVGVIATGSGDWAELVANPQEADFGDMLMMPRQSYENRGSKSEILQLAGIVSWTGKGLVRCDERRFMAQKKVFPGEGRLRIDQIVAEMLSKTGFIPKYGA